MATQSNTFQRKILDSARKHNELQRLYWLVEIKWPLSAIKRGTSLEKEKRRHTNAYHPHRWVPAIPVAPDPAISVIYAEILCALFAHSHRGRGLEFTPALADIETLDTAQWYVYGEDLPAGDVVCDGCGCVNDCVCPPKPPKWALIGRNGHRVHISRDGGTVGLCGRLVRAQWVTPATARERRAWPLATMCDSCYRLYRKSAR